MFNHILVAFDGSDSAKLGLSMGVNHCKTNEKSLLSVVYVYEDKSETLVPTDKFVTASNAPFFADTSQGQAIVSNDNSLSMTSQKNTQLEEIEKYVNSLEDNLINSHFVVLEGDTVDSILQYAEKEGVDLIIVGNSGTTGLRKLFIGSVSEKIIKNSTCPVLLAK